MEIVTGLGKDNERYRFQHLFLFSYEKIWITKRKKNEYKKGYFGIGHKWLYGCSLHNRYPVQCALFLLHFGSSFYLFFLLFLLNFFHLCRVRVVFCLCLNKNKHRLSVQTTPNDFPRQLVAENYMMSSMLFVSYNMNV